MGVFSDIKKSIILWRESSVIFRVITFILTISPVASISDTVFQWKGFFSTGIEFYNDSLICPLNNLLSSLGIGRGEEVVHYLVLVFAFYFSSILSVFQTQFIRPVGKILLFLNYILAFLVLVFITSGESGVSIFQWFFPVFCYFTIPFLLSYKNKFVWYYPAIIVFLSIPVMAAINEGIGRI